MTSEDFVTIPLEVRVPRSQARAFLEACTGNDDDVILAGERAMRQRLEETGAPGEFAPWQEVEVDPDMPVIRDRLRRAAERERLDRLTYGPYASR
jgi:hypothetical protein